MMVTYGSIMAGQMIVAAGDVRNDALFMVTGIFFCCSLIPTAVSSAASPKPLQDVSLDLRGLFANSPVSFVGCLLIGVANGAWGTLGAVYGARIGITTAEIALMMSLVVVAGAAMQMPVGRLSDRTDRRYVLAGASLGSAIFALLVFFATPRTGDFRHYHDCCLRRVGLYTLFSCRGACERPRQIGRFCQSVRRAAAAVWLRDNDRACARRRSHGQPAGPKAFSWRLRSRTPPWPVMRQCASPSARRSRSRTARRSNRCRPTAL